MFLCCAVSESEQYYIYVLWSLSICPCMVALNIAGGVCELVPHAIS